MFKLNPIQLALDMFANLVDVPASLAHLIREAQVEALISQHARPTTLHGLATRACKSATFMGQAEFWSASDQRLGIQQGLHCLYRRSGESPEAVKVILTTAGEAWITAMTFHVMEGDGPVFAEDESGPMVDGEATVKVAWLEDHWAVEVVKFQWANTHIVGLLNQVLARFHPELKLSADQLTEMKLDVMVPALETFIRLIDVPQELSALSRPRQLAALRERYAPAYSFCSLESLAKKQATFMDGGEFLAGIDVHLGAWGWNMLTFEHAYGPNFLHEVEWKLSPDGQVELTCAGPDEDDDRCELSVRITPCDGSWTVEVGESESPLRFLADRINTVLRRFHPRLKLTARQLSKIEFCD